MAKTLNFKFQNNQILWDKFITSKLEECKPRTSINQYKPVLLELENFYNKDFAGIKKQDIIDFLDFRNSKNKNHLNGFYISCFINKWIDVDNELILHLIPKDYLPLVKLLLVSE